MDQLRTLVSVVDEGTFEAAAFELGVSQSAVSQRIKALETELGRVLVQRTTPCRVSRDGEPVLRMARQVGLLEQELRTELGLHETHARLAVAVNADSFATWLQPLLALAATWPDTRLAVTLEDQDHSSELLRRGAVVGAVTSDPRPVPGCRVERLGTMTYVPVAEPTLADRHRHAGRLDWASLPMLRFNAKDELQDRFLDERVGHARPPVSLVPSSQGFVAAILAGLGWGMAPLAQIEEDLRAGRVVRLAGRAQVPVELFWQAWRLTTRPVARLGEAVHACAREMR